MFQSTQTHVFIYPYFGLRKELNFASTETRMDNTIKKLSEVVYILHCRQHKEGVDSSK